MEWPSGYVVMSVPCAQQEFDEAVRRGLASAAVRGRSGLRVAGLCSTLVAFILSACAVGPDFHKPAAPNVTGYSRAPLARETAAAGKAGGGQFLVSDLDIPGQWWAIFHSHPLNDLIEDALQHNADLQTAQAALRVAHENVAAQRGAFYPQVAGDFTGTGGKVGSEIASPLASNAIYYSLYTPQVTVSYTPDVFGRVRREVESDEALAEAQRFQLEATYLTLTSNIVAAAVQEASLRGQIAATEKIIAISKDNLKILRRQHDLGQIADSDVLLQEAALAQVEQTLPPLERQLAQQRNLLTALAGRFPNQEIAQKFTLAGLRLPRELPVSLPSKLVEQRPDVRAAEANLHSASALVGVAIANRLPVVNLTGNFGYSSSSMATLFAPQATMWAVTGSAAQTIFDGFSLYHKEKAAEAAFDQAATQYRSTVITAFQNVADVLRALEADARTLKAAVAAEVAAEKSLDITRKQLALGQVNNLALLDAQRTYLQASLVRVHAQAARYADTAALFQALGGGWWNRSDVTAAAAASGPTSISEFLLPTAAKDP